VKSRGHPEDSLKIAASQHFTLSWKFRFNGKVGKVEKRLKKGFD